MDVAKPYRGYLIAALTLTLIHAGFATAPGIVQKHLIDSAISNTTLTTGERFTNLFLWAGIFAAVILMSEIVGGGRMAILSIVGTRVTRDLRHDVYAHLHKLSMRFFAKRRSGSLITRVTNDTDRLWDFIVFGSVNVVRDVLMITVSVLIMFTMNWRLALVSLVPLPVIAVVTWWRGKKMHAMFGRHVDLLEPHQRRRRRCAWAACVSSKPSPASSGKSNASTAETTPSRKKSRK
ncbi:MAG: ABC transporter transmembrane domain-containing protein [Tepidisphaeraceae bacterium]